METENHFENKNNAALWRETVYNRSIYFQRLQDVKLFFCSNWDFLAVYVFIYSFQLEEKNKSHTLIPGQVICKVFQRVIGERDTEGNGRESDAEGKRRKNE